MTVPIAVFSPFNSLISYIVTTELGSAYPSRVGVLSFVRATFVLASRTLPVWLSTSSFTAFITGASADVSTSRVIISSTLVPSLCVNDLLPALSVATASK